MEETKEMQVIKEPAGQKEKKSILMSLFLFLLKMILVIGALCALFTYILGWTRANDNNMFPMIKDGDFCLYYRLDESFIGDAVVYKDSDGRERTGRIIAVGGQEIDFTGDGGYMINGVTPGEMLPYETWPSEKSDVRYPLILEEGEYFILNDYREDNADSRKAGAIKKEDIKGKIIFIFRRRSI